jgi:hypothetical protein
MADISKPHGYSGDAVEEVFDEYGPPDLVGHVGETNLHPEDVVEGFIDNAAGSPAFAFEPLPTLEPLDLNTDPAFARPESDGAESPAAGPEAAVGTPAAAAPVAQPGAAALDGDHGQQDSRTPAEENAAGVAGIIEEDALVNVDSSTLIFDYGPFAALERRLTDYVATAADPRIAELVTSHVRQAIHEAVERNPMLNKPVNYEAGLRARMESIPVIGQQITKKTTKLFDKLDAAQVDGVNALREGLERIVASHGEIEKANASNLVPVSVGRALFDDMLRGLRASPEGGHLVGNPRTHRNKELTEALGNLKSVADEIHTNTGNPEWEREQGAQSVQAIRDITAKVNGLTQGVEDQVDTMALRKGMNSVNEKLKAASETAEDPELKGKLKDATDAIAEFVKRLTDAISKLFTRSAGPSGPKPT